MRTTRTNTHPAITTPAPLDRAVSQGIGPSPAAPSAIDALEPTSPQARREARPAATGSTQAAATCSLLELRASPDLAAGVERPLGRDYLGREVSLQAGVLQVSGRTPQASPEQDLADALYAAATVIAATDPRRNVFSVLSTAEKRALFEQLEHGLAQVPPTSEVPAGYATAMQARQQRSSIATVMLELLRVCDPSSPKEASLQRAVLEAYAAAARAETSTLLRDSMVLQLHLNRDRLPAPEAQALIDELMELYAPTRLPYDEWFKDGNNTLNIVSHVGSQFFADVVQIWLWDKYKGAGFDATNAALVERTYEHNGIKTVVKVRIVEGGEQGFDPMGDPKAHIVELFDHSDWGRARAKEIRAAPDQVGEKLLLINQCCGRGILNRVHDKFSRAMVVTTRNSGLELEDMSMFSRLVQGIAERRSLLSIAKEVRQDKELNPRDNFYFPCDALLVARALDQDHDGISDVVDRLVDFNTITPAEDSKAEFTARPRAPGAVLEGTKVHEAVQIINTTAEFSGFTKEHMNGEAVVGRGYFAGTASDPMVRITAETLDGKPAYALQVSDAYAHATSEAIKAEAFYTLAWTPPFRRPEDAPLDTALKGLVLAAHSLAVDSGYRDDEIWSALLAKHGLPRLPLSTVSGCLHVGDAYAGAPESLQRLKAALPRALLEKLQQAAEAQAGQAS